MFDFVLDKVVTLFDCGEAIDDIDLRGMGAEFFGDYTMELDFREFPKSELRATFTVTSKTADASYSAYSYYMLDELNEANPRGTVRGYYRNFIEYPGFDTPITVKDVNDVAELMAGENNYILDFAVALCRADKSAMANAIYIQEGALRGWETVKVGDYAITRSDFTYDDAKSFEVYLEITESGLYNLPAGRYSVTVTEGATYPDVVFKKLDNPDEDGKLVDPSIEWLLPWVESHGILYCFDENPYHSQDKVHSFIDYYLRLTRIYGETPALEDFLDFVDTSFGRNSFRGYVSRAMVEEHGGHGFTFALCDIVSHEKDVNRHYISVEYYSDPMETVVARRVDYVLEEIEKGYKIVSAKLTYNSGESILTYGT